MNLVSIGNRVKTLRIDKGLSQDELARRIDFDRTYLSRVESGKQNMTVETLLKICDGLGVTIKEFFDFMEVGNNATID